jgi:hypothetical protein
LIFFKLTLATIFVSARFMPKASKVKERGLKLIFLSSELVKIGRGQQNKIIATVTVATAFRVL